VAESLLWFNDPTTDEGCLSGHYWSGGACTRCGERLRCGACQRFVTIEKISNHIDSECPIKWDQFGGLDDVS